MVSREKHFQEIGKFDKSPQLDRLGDCLLHNFHILLISTPLKVLCALKEFFMGTNH
jgi:hypothetical protein